MSRNSKGKCKSVIGSWAAGGLEPLETLDALAGADELLLQLVVLLLESFYIGARLLHLNPLHLLVHPLVATRPSLLGHLLPAHM